MERRDLTATSYVGARVVALLLVVVGAGFWLAPGLLTDWFGTVERGLGFGLLVAFCVLSSLWMDNHRLRVRLAETTEALHQLLYGRDYSKDREAIEILIRGLAGTDPAARQAAHDHLVRLTGQNFAADPGVWMAWWASCEKTWARKRGSGAPGSSGKE